jgi:hypothetical protein
MLTEKILGVAIGMTATAAMMAMYMTLKDQTESFTAAQNSILLAANNGTLDRMDINTVFEDHGVYIHNLTDEQVAALVTRLEDSGYFDQNYCATRE